jgi:hypothetical protein
MEYPISELPSPATESDLFGGCERSPAAAQFCQFERLFALPFSFDPFNRFGEEKADLGASHFPLDNCSSDELITFAECAAYHQHLSG